MSGEVKPSVERKRRYSADKRLAIIKEAKDKDVKKVAEQYGLHPITVYRWIDKEKKYGQEGLCDKCPTPEENAGNKTSDTIEKAILEEWERHPGFGPSQIRNQLRRQGIRTSVRTIRRIMISRGYLPQKTKPAKSEYKRFEAERPGQLVQMDILEFYIHKLKVYLLMLLDDFSRYIVGYRLCDKCNMDEVITALDEAIKRYGKFEGILTDRGSVFYAWRGMNKFQKILEGYEIDHIVASAHHPQTLGKIEAVNKNIQKELIRIVEFRNLEHAREEIEKWIEEYNLHRTHQGLGDVLVPADRFFGRADKVIKMIQQGGVVGKEIDMEEIPVLSLSLKKDSLELRILGKCFNIG